MSDSPTLTTAQKTAAALAIKCPEHDAGPGEECPVGIDGACKERRSAALSPDGGYAPGTLGALMGDLADPGF